MPAARGAGLIVSIVQCVIFMILGFANLFFGTATEKLTTVVSARPCLRARTPALALWARAGGAPSRLSICAWGALPVVVLRAGGACARAALWRPHASSS